MFVEVVHLVICHEGVLLIIIAPRCFLKRSLVQWLVLSEWFVACNPLLYVLEFDVLLLMGWDLQLHLLGGSGPHLRRCRSCLLYNLLSLLLHRVCLHMDLVRLLNWGLAALQDQG